MNNALESLSGIKQAFASHLVRETSMTFEQALESLNYDTDLQNIEKAIKELAEIKARAEEKRVLFQNGIETSKGTPVEPFVEVSNSHKIKLIDYILKGEKV